MIKLLGVANALNIGLLSFSAAKAAQDMQMSVSLSFIQSFIQSVSHSVNNIYLFVQFTSIFYNSKSDEMNLRLLINQITSNYIKL